MKTAPIVVVFFIILILVVLVMRTRIAPTYSVAASDIPEIIDRLKKSEKDGHFAVIIFVPPDSKDGEAVNLQYSIEAGTVGLDWVLIGARNVVDEEKINEFAAKIGFRFDRREMNGVHYLRVTGNGISELGTKIMQEFYQISFDTKVSIITEGFKWKSN